MSAAGGQVDDSLFEASAFERVLAHSPTRWMGWRRRLLVLAVLASCLGLFATVRVLVRLPAIDAQWQSDARGEPVLQSSAEPTLQALAGHRLLRLSAPGGLPSVDAARLLGSPRWTVDDERRAASVQARAALGALLAGRQVVLHFDDGSAVQVAARARGHAGLGVGFWLLAMPALALTVLGAVVLLARPSAANLLYALMAGCQALSLLWIGVDSGGLLSPLPLGLGNDMRGRLGLDLATAAAAVHVFTLYPRALAWRHAIAAAAWLLAAAATWLLPDLPQAWWWSQAAVLALGLAAIAVLSRSYAGEPNPFALAMRRFGLAALATMAVVDSALVAAEWQTGIAREVATSAVTVWSLFIASLLALVPFLSRTRRLLREMAMLAGMSTIATSLDLLFITLFSLEPFASLTLAVFIALAGYAAARQWMLDQMVGSRVMTTERTFEHLYRIAREVQEAPQQQPALLAELLRALFDPLEVLQLAHAAPRSRVLANGSALVVPVRSAAEGEPMSLVLRFARHGRRIFTREDARLTDRVVDQLRRAVAYDQAVERGRTEERQRIAQDLHDDIGARLLTLMYKAQDPEIEDYLRHTLQDLKTLTRGLAASSHRLSHSVAEWKSDIQQRLTAAHIELGWSFAFNDDPELGVVQWSALTRVLRELVSNAITHAQATRVEIDASLVAGRLQLRVADDGNGRDPQAWSHGLGLGGVRKRVKLLGGEVHWRQRDGQGIVCEVTIPQLLQHR